MNLGYQTNVLPIRSSGAPSIGLGGYNNDNRYELRNHTSITHGTHTIRFGGRLRAVQLDTETHSGFSGAFTFTGGPAPELLADNTPDGNTITITSLESYRRTLLFSGLGYSAAHPRARRRAEPVLITGG